ncbi:MAG: bifunctional phosphopantothenoylcysteine decarboxylase/phosphopantothenate--cysteine ligase CoaBC [Candidatus Dadabacteria bacterium]|nr:MAG: bifunctional phosphopantothenoylcysteine decarboxylase/phosphopantothenate--cysteine ligase CoaBC [Candidatus Dadabacteria bacterium]
MGAEREKRNVALGITGSIAAYKSAELARLLVKRGYNVSCIMTTEAAEFISPLTMETITGRPVLIDIFDEDAELGTSHIQLADWADVLVIAPATANIIARIAHGLAECAVSTVALATKANILVCPAMNVNMLNNPVTVENIEKLKALGVDIVDPEDGELACGWEGLGRLAPPWEIFHRVRRSLSVHDFEGKHILVTTGPTREAIDPVRFISNRSSGKMGVAIAREAFRRGATVELIHGPVPVRVPREVSTIPVVSALEMKQEVMDRVLSNGNPPDVVIMAAAVADFRPATTSDVKVKKKDIASSIPLLENPDILAEIGSARKGDKPILVGFAVETGELEDLISYVRDKLEKKNADIMVGNFANEALELDTNRVWIINRAGRQDEVATTYKSRVANKILDAVLKL